MYSDEAYQVLPLTTPGLGHVAHCDPSSQPTSVNPLDVYLTLPFDIHSNVNSDPFISNNYLGGHLTTGDPAPRGFPGCPPLAQGVLSMNHVPSQSSAIRGVPANPSIAPSMPTPRRAKPRVPRASSARCEWESTDLPRCHETITRSTVSRHLAQHGIRNLPRALVLQCGWKGCGVPMKRGGLTRHVREVHLGLKRETSRQAFPRQHVSTVPFDRDVSTMTGWHFWGGL